MMWYYIFRESDGVLVTESNELRLPLPAGLSFIERSMRVMPSEVWDTATRSFIPRTGGVPDRDLVEEVLSHPTFLTAAPSSFLRSRLRTALEDVLVDVRYQ